MTQTQKDRTSEPPQHRPLPIARDLSERHARRLGASQCASCTGTPRLLSIRAAPSQILGRSVACESSHALSQPPHSLVGFPFQALAFSKSSEENESKRSTSASVESKSRA